VTLAEVTRAAVLRAIRECRRVGRDVFLAKHGYRKGIYRLVHAGREYDSKAILGVAFGYEFGCEPLDPRKFSGGVEHVARILLRLGFSLRRGVETLTEQLVSGVLRLVRRVRRVVAAMTDGTRDLLVGLVSCSKAKLDKPAKARALYEPSYVFARSKAYVEQRCDAWWILSAKHGLVHPDTVLAPYDETLAKMRKAARDLWASSVRETLCKRYAGIRVKFLLMAGQLYAKAVEGLAVEEPLKGLSTGHRRRWLAQHT
jgi:ribosomal protein S27AE